VLDENSLVIGQYFDSEESRKILQNSTPYFLTLNDSLTEEGGKASQMVVRREEKVFYFDQFQIERTETPLYLLIMSPQENFPQEQVTAFTKMIQGII